MKFDSMVVYRTWMETFDDLDNETVGEVIKMIMHYGMEGEDISDQMSPAARAIFKMSKGNIDANKQKKLSGSKGGKAKTKQTESKPQANVKQTTSKREADTKQTASNVNVNVNANVNANDNNKTSSPPRTASDARFDIFWQTYPKKVGKKAAQSAWKKAKITSEQFQDVIRAVEEQQQSDQWNRGFIPNPATWLNQGRWDDEVPEARAAPGDVLSEVFAEMERKEAVG